MMSFDSLDLVRRFGAPLWCAALVRRFGPPLQKVEDIYLVFHLLWSKEITRCLSVPYALRIGARLYIAISVM